VREKPIAGKQGFFDQIGATAARRRTSRHSDTPRRDTPHARRRVALEDFRLGDPYRQRRRDSPNPEEASVAFSDDPRAPDEAELRRVD
jgi:hypothetical protein